MNVDEKLPVSQTFYSRWESGARSLSKCAALISLMFGAAVLVGWWLNVPMLNNPAYDTIPVAVSTGICFIFFGLAVLWHYQWLTRTRLRELKIIRALKHSEEKTRKIIDKAYDAFIAIDKEGRIIDWNSQAEKMFGYVREDVLGKPLSECIIPPELRQSHEEGIRRFMETGHGDIINHRIQLPAMKHSGERFPIELAVFPVEFQDTTTFCTFVQDITDRKRSEAEIEALNEQLRMARDEAIQGSKLKSEFLANVSHEIRTPMNAVIGLSDLLRRTQLTKEQIRFVNLIVNSGNSLLQIIDDILIFSKIEAGRLDLETEEFDLIAAVESAADLLSEKAREKQLSLTTFLEPDIMQFVRGDAQRLRQILLNLISNAIKFTDRGRVLVRASLESNSDETQTICFSVSDTGIGISEEGLKLLFTPFTQVDGSSTRRHGGTGLGLTITKRLVEMMGGTIDVISSEGKGSTFTFCIPFQRAASDEKESEVAASYFANMRMLMLGLPEDEASVVELYAESWGLRSSYAVFSEEAFLTLAHAAHEGDPFTFVLLNAKLQDGEAIDFVDRLASESYGCQSILLLGMDDVDKIDESDLARFADILHKPIKQSALFNSLISLLRESHIQSMTDIPVMTQEVKLAPAEKYVLVVEDNVVNQEVAVLLLEELGLNAHVVPNGRESLLASTDPNCQMILMDCQMPEMDGFEATRLIREREGKSEVHMPIVAMTAHAMEGDRELCLAAGMDDYLPKPVTLERLRETVTRWIPETAAEAMSGVDTGYDIDVVRVAGTKAGVKGTPSGEGDRKTRGEGVLPEEPLYNEIDLTASAQVMLDKLLDEAKAELHKSMYPQSQIADINLESVDAHDDESPDFIDVPAAAMKDPEKDSVGPIGRKAHKRINMTPHKMKPADAISEAEKILRDTNSGRFGVQPQPAGTQANSLRQNHQMTIPNEPMNNNAVNGDALDINSILDYKALESNFGAQSAKKFLNLFVATTPALLSRLETSIKSTQIQPAKAAAHELKGMSATINIMRMYDLCRTIEKSVDESNWSEAETLLAHLKIAFYQAEAAIKKL